LLTTTCLFARFLLFSPQPNHCLNSVCENRQRWILDTSLSTFSDWQLVRIQENSHEIPAGSMPRSMKIVLRHDVVELAKPGDKCVFTGTLIVVPDISQLGGGAAGARFSKGGGGGNGRRTQDSGTGGVMGLKELGVRDLTYSLCFLAHSVRTSHSAFGSVAMQSDANVRLDADGTPVEDTEEAFTDAEKDRVQEMKAQGKLYTRLVASIAPNIFGQANETRIFACDSSVEVPAGPELDRSHFSGFFFCPLRASLPRSRRDQARHPADAFRWRAQAHV